MLIQLRAEYTKALLNKKFIVALLEKTRNERALWNEEKMDRVSDPLVGKTRLKGVKVQHMLNVEKANQELDIMTMCHTEHNEAPKIFIVSSGKDIVVLSLGSDNLSFSIEGNNLAWALLVALSYYYVFDQSFCTAYCQILYLMQRFILGDMMKSKGKLSSDTNTVLMWMNTHKSNPKYCKGFIPIR